MGKIRVHTIGDESAEQKQKEKAQKRKESKEVVKIVAEETKSPEVKVAVEEKEVEKKEEKKGYKKKAPTDTKHKDSSRHAENTKKVEKSKFYALAEAVDLLSSMKKAKFDETVELHINTNEKGVTGTVTLPHGSGKQTRVAILQPSKDQKGADALVKEIESGTINFDILIATPDAMPKLAKVARILGPRGLMPNPKNGTVTQKPEEIAKKYAGGQINFKTEAKAPVIHLAVGKVSFGKDKLVENVQTAIEAIQLKNIKNATLKSTMSAGIKILVG